MTINYWHGWDSGGVLQYNGVMPDDQGVVIPGPPFPVSLNFDVKYYHVDILGFTVSRELFGLGKATCQSANPILRVEALYSFNQKFNTKEGAFDPVSGAPTMLFKVVDKDQIRYMVGLTGTSIRFSTPEKAPLSAGSFFTFTPLILPPAMRRCFSSLPITGGILVTSSTTRS